MPEQKKKVVFVFNWDNGWSTEYLVLTESQIRLLNWLIKNDFLDRATIAILEDQQEWEEI